MWPLSDDICWIPVQDILMRRLNASNIINNRQYRFINILNIYKITNYIIIYFIKF